jgi:hypothetical protein
MAAYGLPSETCYAPMNVRFGSKADIRAAKRHVRFAPESGREKARYGIIVAILKKTSDAGPRVQRRLLLAILQSV